MSLVSQEAVVPLLTKVETLRPSKTDKPKLRRLATPLLSRADKPRQLKGVLLPPRRRRREDRARPPKEEPPPPQTKMARAKLLREPLLRLSRAVRLRRLRERMLLLPSKARKARLPKLVLLLLRRREGKARLLREQMLLLLLIRVLKPRRSRARGLPMQHRLKETQPPTEVALKSE